MRSVSPLLTQISGAFCQRLGPQRDAGAVKTTLTALDQAARGQANLMPCIIDAVRAYATLGEISDILRTVFGEYQGVAAI